MSPAPRGNAYARVATPRTVLVTVRCTAQEREAWHAMAKTRGVTIACMVRVAMRRATRRQDAQQGPFPASGV